MDIAVLMDDLASIKPYKDTTDAGGAGARAPGDGIRTG